MSDIVAVEAISDKIFEIRGQKVMLDRDLAHFFGVTTGNLNKAVKRNKDRFPPDFMFRLTTEETQSLIFQFGRSKTGRGGSRHSPYAFTEQGVSMLSTVLNSPKAVEISILIIRAFVRLRTMLAKHEALRLAIQGLERRVGRNERDIQLAIGVLQNLLKPAQTKPKPSGPIGFGPRKKKQPPSDSDGKPATKKASRPKKTRAR